MSRNRRPLLSPTEIHTAWPLFRLLVDQGFRVAAFPIATGPFEAFSCLVDGQKEIETADWP